MYRVLVMLLALWGIMLLGAGCRTPRPRPLAWDVLPFATNSDWSGPRGLPADLESGDLILQGRKVRTSQAYSAPVTISCEVEVEDRLAPDGSFAVDFVPIITPRDLEPVNVRSFRMIYRNPGASSGRDGLVLAGRDGSLKDATLWGEAPFTVEARKFYAIQLDVATNGMHAVIDGHTYDLTGVKVPYNRFYIQLGGWPPTDRWRVRSFSIH